jgi:Kef-type K+ transport system membrane component KefB
MKTKTKGLEPIVAAVLLIVVAVIGAVLIYLWFAGYVTKATSQAESMAASEKLKIEAASLIATGGGSGFAMLYIRNLGGDAVTLVQAYVFRPGSTSALCTVPIVFPPIQPGELAIVPPGLPGCGIYAGYDYVIKVVTLKGTEFAVTVTAS